MSYYYDTIVQNNVIFNEYYYHTIVQNNVIFNELLLWYYSTKQCNI